MDNATTSPRCECGGYGGKHTHQDCSAIPPWEINKVQTENNRGEWVPAIPLPLLGLRKRCRCGETFWTMDGYRGHYALVHILALGAPSQSPSGSGEEGRT